MRSLLLVLALGGAACTGSKPPQPPPADASLPACTMALYDPCITEHGCSTGICKDFASDGFMVCSTTCTPGNDAPCIVAGGQAGTCNMMGFCKPPAANMCQPKP